MLHGELGKPPSSGFSHAMPQTPPFLSSKNGKEPGDWFEAGTEESAERAWFRNIKGMVQDIKTSVSIH